MNDHILKSRADEITKAARQFVSETMQKIQAQKPHAVIYTQGQHNAVRALFVAAFGVIDELQTKIKTLEEDVRRLSDQSPLKYVGVWNEHQQYDHGNLCTDHGSLWHANQSTRRRPGTSKDWTLAVKRGKGG